tara:strand:+ start:5378 stop:5563 length:186 start_codon:yes stop_codon:yes gene_type:complete
MPRDPDKMKLVSCFVTKEFKRKLEKEAKRLGISVSDLVRLNLKKHMGTDDNIGSQKKSSKR